MQSFRPAGRSVPPRPTPGSIDDNKGAGDRRITYEDWLQLVARSAKSSGSHSASLAGPFRKMVIAAGCLSVAAGCGWLLTLLLKAT